MITLYSKPACPNCDVVKNSLHKAGMEFTTVECNSLGQLGKQLQGSAFEDQVYEFSGFPIATRGEWIGGFQEIMEKYSEPLLESNPDRYTMYPVAYPAVYEMYKKARASYWQPEEISLAKDLADWKSLTKDEQRFVSYILAFFSASDGIVNENIDVNFSKEIEHQEVRAFYAFQEAMEAVHSETYSILLDTYVSDQTQKQFLQNGIKNIPSVQTKASWAQRFMHRDKSFAIRLLAFACVEGIYFSGSFCAIFWLKKRNLLPGLAFSNELISRDEGLHTDFAVLLFSYLKNRPTEEEVLAIVTSAVDNEKQFITESLPCKLIGMNCDLMSQYIEFVADRLLNQLGYSKHYHSQCPFDFMENISLSGKTNFFEKRVGEYAKAGVMASVEDDTFGLDADF